MLTKTEIILASEEQIPTDERLKSPIPSSSSTAIEMTFVRSFVQTFGISFLPRSTNDIVVHRHRVDAAALSTSHLSLNHTNQSHPLNSKCLLIRISNRSSRLKILPWLRKISVRSCCQNVY
jgi:hypothetical protein